MIATLATRADAAGIKTCVVSTDRDAFQLCSENVCLMMTPRGVSDVQRLHARARRAPLRRPARPGAGLHRAEGRHLRQHPGRPRDRRQDGRTADRPVRLARGGDRARGRALAGSAQEHHRARRAGTRVEGPRDDAARARPRLGADRARARARPTARSSARCSGASSSATCWAASTSWTRRCRRRCPSRSRESTVAWREGELPPLADWEGYAADGDRVAVATANGVVVRAEAEQRSVARRAAARRPRREVAQGAPRVDDTHDRRVPDRARARRVRARRPERRVRARGRCPEPAGRGGDRRARPPRRGAAAADRADARAGARARLRAPLPRDRAAADRRARGDGGRRASRSTPTEWARSRRGSSTGSRSSRRRRTSSRARSSCSARRSRSRGSSSRSSS